MENNNKDFCPESYTKFLDHGYLFGKETMSEFHHGSGVDTEERAEDFLKYFGGKLEEMNELFNNLKKDISDRYPNLK